MPAPTVGALPKAVADFILPSVSEKILVILSRDLLFTVGGTLYFSAYRQRVNRIISMEELLPAEGLVDVGTATLRQ